MVGHCTCLCALVLSVLVALVLARSACPRFPDGQAKYGARGPALAVRVLCEWNGLYNPSVAQHGDRWVVALRYSTLRDRNSVVVLGSAIEPASLQEALLTTVSNDTGESFVDIRLFVHEDKLYGTAHCADEAYLSASMHILALPGGASSRLALPAPQAWEKNWMPVSCQGGMYFIHTIAPPRVLKAPAHLRLSRKALTATRCEDVPVPVDVPCPPLQARGSSAACAVGDELLFAAHRRYDRELPHFAQILLATESRPPFRGRAQTPEFALVGSDARTREVLARGFHFVNGLAVRGQTLLFAVGIDDKDAVILEANLNDALRLLQPF